MLRQQINHRLNQCVGLLICLQHRIHPAGVTGRIMLGQFVRGSNENQSDRLLTLDLPNRADCLLP